jgi:DNA-binding SARP family transcriptional activator/DNA-binding beta-propeller fold protein YncE
VEFRILGPLEVLEDGRPLGLGRLKERTVLAVLLLHANEFVSRERLIDELWGVAPPATARKAVNVYVSKLRKTLSGNGHDPIATADGGYRLVVDSDLLDADRMRSLVARARERMGDGESVAASRLLNEALAFWRGPTLAGLALESVGRDEVAQLDELRLAVVMDRIDCDLAQGRHEQVLGELQLLVREHPLKERLRAQQMLALYRADRQADALEAYQQARHDLIDELGIEPSESLQRLQQAILRHDPALEAPAGTAAANGAPPAAAPSAAAAPAVLPPRSHRRRPTLRRRHLVAVGLAAVAAVAALVAFLSTRGSGPEPPSSPVSYTGSDTSVVIDPSTDKFVPGPGGGVKPGPMAVVGNRLWIVTRGNAQIQPYDLRTERETHPFPAGTSPYDIVADANGAWVSQRKPFVTWIRHPASYYDTHQPYATPVTPTQNIRLPLRGAGAEAYGGGYLWVIPGPLSTGNRVALIDVRHRLFRRTIPLGPGLQTSAIAYGYGAAWIAAWDPQHSTAWLERVRAGSPPIVQELETGDGAGPLAVAVGDGSVWVATSRGNLLGIDPKTLKIAHRISMSDAQPTLLAVVAGSVWTANHKTYSVSRVDSEKNKIVHTFPLGSYRAIPCGIAGIRDAVYVTFGETTCG